jgi:hypothetical protein
MNEAEQAPVTEAMGEEAEMEEVDVNKTVTEETGDSDAEERLENVTPTTDESLQDLKKSVTELTTLLRGNQKKKVAKIQKAQSSNTQSIALTEIATVIKQLADKLDAQDKFNEQLMQNIGLTDDIINKTLPEKSPANNSKPIQSLDTAVVIKDIVTSIFKEMPELNRNPETRHPFNDKREARKNLQGIAEFIHKGNR